MPAAVDPCVQKLFKANVFVTFSNKAKNLGLIIFPDVNYFSQEN